MSKPGVSPASAPAPGGAPGVGTLSHAGTVVWRDADDGPLFLLLTAMHAPSEWVLPKGHIEKGESPANAARREVREEAGINVRVGEYLGTETFTAKGKKVVCAYYLARCPRVAPPEEAEKKRPLRATEGRMMVWLSLTDAIGRSTFPAGRSMLAEAGSRLGISPA